MASGALRPTPFGHTLGKTDRGASDIGERVSKEGVSAAEEGCGSAVGGVYTHVK